jgi:hypothetical protein
MTVGIVAFTEDRPIQVGGEVIGMEPVRRAKTIPARHGCGSHGPQSFSQDE